MTARVQPPDKQSHPVLRAPKVVAARHALEAAEAARDALERAYLVAVLAEAGSVERALEALGWSRSSLFRKLREHSISTVDARAPGPGAPEKVSVTDTRVKK